jgi:Glycosyl hydrolase family 47
MLASPEAQDTLGGYALTLVDTLDTIALMGAQELRVQASRSRLAR